MADINIDQVDNIVEETEVIQPEVDITESETVTDETEEQSTGRLYRRSEVNRIKKNLIKGLKEKDALITRYQAELADIKSKIEAPLEKKRADFVDDVTYRDYQLDEMLEKKLLARDIVQKETSYSKEIDTLIETQNRAIIDTYNTSLDKFETEFKGTKEAIHKMVEEAGDSVTPDICMEIITSDLAAEIMHHFTKNPDDFWDYLELDEVDRKIERRNLEKEIKKAIRKVPKGVSAPETSIRNVGGTNPKSTVSEEDLVQRFRI